LFVCLFFGRVSLYECLCMSPVSCGLWLSSPCSQSWQLPLRRLKPVQVLWTDVQILIKQLMVRQRKNSSSPPPMLLPQHVSVIRPSSRGKQILVCPRDQPFHFHQFPHDLALISVVFCYVRPVAWWTGGSPTTLLHQCACSNSQVCVWRNDNELMDLRRVWPGSQATICLLLRKQLFEGTIL
jgi:hypothetical protein